MSAIERKLKKIVTFGTKRFVRYSWYVRYSGCPLLRGFTVYIKAQGVGVASEASTPHVERNQAHLGLFKLI